MRTSSAPAVFIWGVGGPGADFGRSREDHVRGTAHAQYGKVQTRREKYKAHVEDHEPKKPTIHEGDKVLIAETRRTSKDKRWRVVKVIEKAAAV